MNFPSVSRPLPVRSHWLWRCFGLWLLAALPGAAQEASPTGAETARTAGADSLLKPSAGRGLRVLILCDSMGLSGFADELDARFRECPGVASVHTFAACGSNPLSWMKKAPYARAQTHCGYLRIESTGEAGGISVERDIYGIPAGHKPGGHRIPKIEDLVQRIQPDILVMQNGNNFFDLFKNGQTSVEKTRDVMRTYLAPLRQWLASSAPSVRRFYWVTPPEAGNVSAETQQVVFDTIREEVEPYGTVLDSRLVTSYPYPAQGADQMHFWGDEALAWGRDTFRLLAEDLGRRGLGAPSAEERLVEVRRALPVEEKTDSLILRVRLEKLTPVPPPEAFAPYGELLVAYVYRVLKVRQGRYPDKHLVILHPAYINHERVDMSHFKRRRVLDVEVREMPDDSLWATVRREEGEAPLELMPYMLVGDEALHPNHAGSDSGEE